MPSAIRDCTCIDCGELLPVNAPSYQTRCRMCFSRMKREETQEQHEALLRRALEAEAKVELAKQVVLQLQGQLRAAQGRERAAQGRVGVQQGPVVSGAPGLDLATLARMRRLCHPDKHNGSAAAVEVSQLLNQLIDLAS